MGSVSLRKLWVVGPHVFRFSASAPGRRGALVLSIVLATVALSWARAADIPSPEKPIELSRLQRALDEAAKKSVMSEGDRPERMRHYFRRKTLAFRPEGVKEQIAAYEKEDRKGYGDGPFYVEDATGKTGKDAAWEKWFEEIFTIEQDWAQGLKVPYFCSVLLVRDGSGQPLRIEGGSVDKQLELSRRAVRSLLRPLVESAKSPAGATTLAEVPMYVVKYMGNFEGNSKFVKLYVGKKDSAEFLVFDVSVYDHY